MHSILSFLVERATWLVAKSYLGYFGAIVLAKCLPIHELLVPRDLS
jgi:hypothetical protein